MNFNKINNYEIVKFGLRIGNLKMSSVKDIEKQPQDF